MTSINNQMTAMTPSSFGMPACGHATETIARGTATNSVVRDRGAALVKGDQGFAIAYVPGTSAWRPPRS